MAVDRVLRTFARNLCVSQRRTVQTLVNERDTQTKVTEKSRRIKHPYKRLFPWNTLEEFVNALEKNVVFNDKHVVAIDKPWGVGIHKANVIVNKKNTTLLLSEVIGTSKYCVADAVPFLAERLSLPKLRITKAIDRHMSGVMILTASDKADARVKTALHRAIGLKVPPSTYWCITKGYPLINGIVQERVGITMVEVDEFGDYKEPMIKYNFSKSEVASKKVRAINCEMSIKSLNKSLSAAVVELSSSSNKFNFVRTYITSKTSFILGDTRMAARVKQVLGVPIQVSPYNVGYYDDYEPLSKGIRERLGVERNRQIPLMIHRQKMTLPMYNRDKSNLIIESKELPQYFLWTLQQLNLA